MFQQFCRNGVDACAVYVMSVADHNRVHATDVLHGVYYLTSQRIPGFRNVTIDSDRKPVSSSESGKLSFAKLLVIRQKLIWHAIGRWRILLHSWRRYAASVRHALFFFSLRFWQRKATSMLFWRKLLRRRRDLRCDGGKFPAAGADGAVYSFRHAWLRSSGKNQCLSCRHPSSTCECACDVRRTLRTCRWSSHKWLTLIFFSNMSYARIVTS